MFKFKKENIYNYLLLFLSSAFLIYFYGPVVWAPNDILFSKYGDGFSQYYNFTYYINHNKGWFDYSGSNYPYGEHYVYFDGQPFFAGIIKALASIFPFIKDYTIGLMNSFTLFSLWWTPFLLFSILLRLGVRPILGVLGAIGIMAMEPQAFRMLGHFSLSYSCAIPLVLYLMLRVLEEPDKKRWVVLIAFFNFMWLFTHPYLGLMCCLLTASVWFFHWLWKFRTLAKNYKNYVFPVITMLLPIIAFQVIVKLTDLHPDKADNVYGIFAYCGEMDDVFVPHHPPFKPYFDAMVSGPIRQTWEGWAYVGLTTMFTLFIAFLIYLSRKLRKKESPIHKSAKPIVWVAFLGTVPLLILSWAFPFKQFPVLLDYVSLIKQFRSLGRFAWPFYYVSTLTSIYLIHRAVLTLELSNKKIIGYLLIIIGPLLYFVEGYEPHMQIAEKITKTPNFFIEKHRPELIKEGLGKIDPDKYQAILPLPFYYLGSGNYHRPLRGGAMHMGMLTSVATGLPTLSAAISRGDVWESRNIVQLISPPYYKKKIEDDLPSDKPILVVRSNYHEKLSPYEQMILDRCRLIAIDEWGYSFYEISKKDLFENQSNQVLNEFEQVRPRLYEQDGWLLHDTTTFLLYDDFEKNKSAIKFRGEGAFVCDKQGTHPIKSFAPTPANKTRAQEYHLKMWVYNGAIDAMNYFYIVANASTGGKGWKRIDGTRPDEAITINGDWSLVELSFVVPPKGFDQIHISAFSRLDSKLQVYLDDLLIYTKSNNVYKVVDTKGGKVNELIYNGHQIIRKPK